MEPEFGKNLQDYEGIPLKPEGKRWWLLETKSSSFIFSIYLLFLITVSLAASLYYWWIVLKG
jgi:hypothetical protein